MPSDELWEVLPALYGLQTSPGDWAAFRDAEVGKWRWKLNGAVLRLQATSEPSLWRAAP